MTDSSWETKKLSELADMCLGKMLDQHKNKGDYYPYLANTNVHWGKIDLENLREMRFEAKEFDRYGLKVGDIVMCEGGEPGRCALWKGQTASMMIQKALHRIRAKDCVNNVFLFYTLLNKGLQGHYEGFATGSAIKHLTGVSLANIEVNIPPLQTQQKIAAILSAYDDLIENNLQRIKLLEEMAQITYEEWFVRMKFPGHETAQWNKATGLPEGWRIIKTGDVFKTSSGGTPSRKNPEYFGEGVKWIRTQELNDGLILDANESITELGLKNSSAKVFPKNTVLLAMYGNTIGETGYLTFESATNQACCAFLTDEFSSYYLHQYLKINKQQVLNLRMGAAQENISQDIIKKMPILLPSEDMIQLFGRAASALYKSMESILKQNELLREAREILLPRLMTGVIDVDQVEVPEALLARVG